ncbi:Yhb1 nitric oxide dioxygenase [Candida orthopsilosis Co 90-125]|uniref:nitric oxide dioxygenase n=1 Tax=Candida orthopsilosis (strain 90-125) TaxID=1136231 RepID=H8X8D5_CANO9|nr:Yhb1 nitric oxide dioxygenase [Candida orthopsilosis Co 90-125]CCG24410.1 Yhb1 nitric oxide dioxygenase [Candida orthopsilosis Co 90-125]
MTQTYKQQDLTPEQIKLILNTVPILEQAGETLTAKFYNRMLTNYDEVKPFFNETDQKLLRQPRILAFALLNYAKNIEDLTPLTAFVQQIVSKHIGLQVKAEHYPIVGTCLIETMVEILPKDIATPEFIEAWSIAYGNLAALLIGLEASEYKKEPWQGFKPFKVTKIVEECSDVKSVYFTPKDGSQIPPSKPGQYVCIRWKLPGEKFEKSREYSISQVPENNEFRISVRKLEGGKISTFVHEQLKVGDVLSVAPPNGNFTYKEEPKEKNLVLIAGGIGITPLVSISQTALSQGRKVKLVYANRSVNHRAFGPYFKKQLEAYPETLSIVEYFSHQEGDKVDAIADSLNRKLSLEDLDFIDGSKDEVYLLGPRGFMKVFKEHLNKKGIEVNLEYFGPLDV